MPRPTRSDAQILAQLPAARRRARATKAVVQTARYQRGHRRLEVVLSSGATLLVPVDLIASLRHATDAELADVRVGPGGLGLRWERFDEDLSIAGLARVALGRDVLMRASGAAGGAARTDAKSRASRANGRKGGRPRKVRDT